MLVFSNVNIGGFFILINLNFNNLSRAKSIANISIHVVVISYDVDFLLISNLAHHRIDARTVTANERSDRVNAWHRASNRKFGAATSFASDTFDLDGASFHLGYFLTEEIFDKVLAAAAEDQLRAAAFAFDVFD